jgi:hypothetical protein
MAVIKGTFLSTENLKVRIEPSAVRQWVMTHDKRALLAKSYAYTNTSLKLLETATLSVQSFLELMADVESKMNQMKYLLYEEDTPATRTKRIKSFVIEREVKDLINAQEQLSEAFFTANNFLKTSGAPVKKVQDSVQFYNFILYSYTFVSTACQEEKDISSVMSEGIIDPSEFEAVLKRMEVIRDDFVLLLKHLDIDTLRENAYVLYGDFLVAVPEEMRKRLLNQRKSCAVM